LIGRLALADLSFNNIQRVRGLSGLARLRDLSLFNNVISHIDSGVAACASLQCLSLGNNRLSSLDEVIALRGLRSLAALSLAGNPLATADHGAYQSWCLAIIPQLKYLDHVLITPSQVMREYMRLVH
jgi:Leucine-rich repeat (LRR) protein